MPKARSFMLWVVLIWSLLVTTGVIYQVFVVAVVIPGGTASAFAAYIGGPLLGLIIERFWRKNEKHTNHRPGP